MRFMIQRLFVVLYLVPGLAMLSLGTPQAHSQLIAHTDFLDGGDGTLSGDISGTGWADDGWEVANADLGGTVVPVDWTHDVPGLGTITASTAVQFTGSPLGSGVQRALASEQSADEIYISFLTKWETGVVNGNDFVIWYFETNGGPNIGYKSNEGSGDDGLDFVARTNGSTNQYSTDLEVGELYFVVGRLSKTVPGADELYNQFELWVNPGFEDANDPQSISEGDSNISAFTNIGVRSHQINPNGDEPDDLRFANLRIAETWADVFPSVGALPDPGDFNNDGQVDIMDFEILAANMFAHLDGVRGFENGDMNRNGRIDLQDFHEFVAAFNAPAAAQSVPEPSTGLLLVIPLIVLIRSTRSSRRA